MIGNSYLHFYYLPLVLVFIVFTWGYGQNNLDDKYNITENDYKQYIQSVNSAKDLVDDGLKILDENWKDFVESLTDFSDINFNWHNDESFFGNLGHIFTSIFNVLKYPIKLIVNFGLFLYNNIAIFIYYIICFLTN